MHDALGNAEALVRLLIGDASLLTASDGNESQYSIVMEPLTRDGIIEVPRELPADSAIDDLMSGLAVRTGELRSSEPPLCGD